MIPETLKNKLRPLQRLWSSRLRRITDKLASVCSFADTMDLANEFLHRKDDSFAKMTIADTARQDGDEKEKNDTAFVVSTFAMTEWLDDSGLVKECSLVPKEIASPSTTTEGRDLVDQKIQSIIESYNEGRPDEEKIKDTRMIEEIERCPENSVFVMVDSIVVPYQKKHRNVNGIKGMAREKKRTSIANAYILSREGSYCFTAASEEDVLKKVLAYLVHNDLLRDRELIFFADGAKSIKSLVERYFSFREYAYYIDWYHVHKKCYEYFSMALKGGKKNKERNSLIRYEFFKRLWAGNIKEAAEYLATIDESAIKSKPMIEAIRNYIEENKKDDLYCYALRKGLGLVNSSNRCEKENDTVVGHRCKGNAMSWSDKGALYMAQIRILFLNGEDRHEEGKLNAGWFSTRQAKYTPCPLSECMKKYMRNAA